MGINVGAPTRAVMLEDHWSFVCTCKRCLDPTELGTYASALRCLACGPGSEALILPMVNKLDGAKATKWCCNTCEMELSREQVEAIVETGLRIIKYVNVSFVDIVIIWTPRRKRGAQHGGYENLWFSRLNLVETFSKHSLHVNNIVFVA